MIVLIILLIISVLLGIPIVFSIGLPVFLHTFIHELSISALFQQMVRGLDSFVLVSVPAFILAGNIMNEGGITRRLFHFANCLVGHVRGGLAHANVICSIIFAGMSGSAIADAGGLGSIEIKAMNEHGYEPEFSAAVTAASSTIGPIIPPSVPAVIYAASGGVSVGKLFLAGFLPGLLIAVSFMLLIYVVSLKRGYGSEKRVALKKLVHSFFSSIWALLTPVVLLGGIFSGIFTPTEAAAVSVVYAIIVAKFIYKELTLKKLYKVMIDSMLTSAVVGIIIAVSFGLSYLFTLSQVPQRLAMSLTEFTTNPLLIFLILNCFFFILGMFMDPTASILIVTPILMPIILRVGIDPVHFGIVMILNLMIGLLTPPVGMSLYTVANIGKVSIASLIKELKWFYLILLVVLVLLVIFPQITMVLPSILMGD